MEEIKIPQLTNISKEETIKKIEDWLEKLGLEVNQKDLQRPWGAFWYIKPGKLDLFLSIFFPEIKEQKKLNLSPKILLISPKQRLSWQWHQRRSEIWKILSPVGILLSDTDEIPPQEQMEIKKEGEITKIPNKKRHRLIGLKDNYGLVAEIWQHLDPQNPSNEEDETRVQDDYGRI